MSVLKFRVRTVLIMSGFASCLLVFSSVRCALFSMSCPEQNPVPDFLPHKNDIEKDLERFFTAENGVNSTVRSSTKFKYASYYDALKRCADKKGVIILVSTDYGYIHMALNLYFTSLKRFNITNYLYLTSDDKAAELLKNNGVAHFMLAQDKDGKSMSTYGTAAFRRKTHIKTRIILDALKYGFTVLIVDVDIVFLKNPFSYLNCAECDIQIQSDGNEGNSGFYMARPSSAAITLHQTALDTAVRTPSLSNQKAIDRAMERMSRKGTLKLKMLPVDQFPHGNHFYEKGRRMFAGDNPCQPCVIVHNNWIVSGSAKEYRFKEFLMWEVDTNGYYTNPKAKYLVYDNPFDFGQSTTVVETEALRSAFSISHLLGRILILPAFHCYGCHYASCKLPADHTGDTNPAHCSLNTHIRVSTLNKAFSNDYREHVFLKHHMVPKEILLSQSDSVLIKTNRAMTKIKSNDLNAIKHQFTPANTATGATSTEVLKWLDSLSDVKVLRFHSMYNAFGKFDANHTDTVFEGALKMGIVKADYRQY